MPAMIYIAIVAVIALIGGILLRNHEPEGVLRTIGLLISAIAAVVLLLVVILLLVDAADTADAMILLT